MKTLGNRRFVRICGNDYEIKYSNPHGWAKHGMGRTDEMEGEILINHDLESNQSVSTQLHEIVHVMLDSLGYHEASGDEKFVASFASALTAFIRDNPMRLSMWRETWDMSLREFGCQQCECESREFCSVSYQRQPTQGTGGRMMVDQDVIETKLQEIEDAIDADEGDYRYHEALRDALYWVLGHTGADLEI